MTRGDQNALRGMGILCKALQRVPNYNPGFLVCWVRLLIRVQQFASRVELVGQSKLLRQRCQIVFS